MPSHSNSFSLTRREFLKSLATTAAWGAFSAIASSRAASPATLLEKNWQVPCWVMDLHTGKVFSPLALPAPMALPGSLMKLVAVSALLEGGLIRPEERLACRGSLYLGHQHFQCQHAHGWIDLASAIGFSCNVYFAQASQRFSGKHFLAIARQLGLERPAMDAKGDLPPFRFPKQPQTDSLCASLVLGLNRNLQPNALQLLRMAALIATCRVPGWRPETWQTLHDGMRLAVRRGTASLLDPRDELRAAAKTGTTAHGQTFQSWLIGYFPFEKPRYAFCTRAFAGTSRENAVPMARSFLLERAWY